MEYYRSEGTGTIHNLRDIIDERSIYTNPAIMDGTVRLLSII